MALICGCQWFQDCFFETIKYNLMVATSWYFFLVFHIYVENRNPFCPWPSSIPFQRVLEALLFPSVHVHSYIVFGVLQNWYVVSFKFQNYDCCFSGQGKGFDIDLVKMISDAVSIPVIASSGAGASEHFSDVFSKTNASAALAAGIFHRKEVKKTCWFFITEYISHFELHQLFPFIFSMRWQILHLINH